MSKLDVATMSIGQGIAVTPLQWYVPLVLFSNGGRYDASAYYQVL